MLLLACCAAPALGRAAEQPGMEIPIRVSPDGKPRQPRKIVIPDGPVLPEPLEQARWRQDRSGAALAPMQESSLVLDNPSQRGLSGDVWARSGSLHMAGIGVGGDIEQNLFGDGTDEDSGQPRGLVLSRALGGDSNPQALSVTGTYLKNEAQVDALGQIEGSSSDATNLALDSHLMGGRLQLRGQYAFTRYDPDGPLLNSDAQTGTAHALMARLNAVEVPLGGKDLSWSVGTRQREVGEEFYSEANPYLPRDQRLQSVFSELRWGGLSAIGEMAHTEDNLDGDPTRQRTVNDSVSAQLHYRPTQAQDGDASHLFDQPDLQLNYREGKAKNTAGDPLNSYQEVGISAAFSPGKARWALGYSVGRSEDETGWGSDTQTQTRSVDVSLPIGPWLTFQPSFQDREQVYVDTNVAETHLDLGARLKLNISDKWTGALGYRLSTHGASDGSVDASSDEMTARIEHQFLAPRANRPGVRLHLQGTYQRYQNDLDPAGNYDQRDAEIGVQLNWPLD